MPARAVRCLSLSLLVLAGCTGTPTEDPLPEGPITFSGALTLAQNTLGYDESGTLDETCTAEFTLSGVEAEVECPGCLWALEIEGTEVSNGCTETYPEVTFTDSESDAPLYLGFWGDAWEGPWTAALFEENPDDPLGIGLFGPLDGNMTTADESFALDGTNLEWTSGLGLQTFNGSPQGYDFCPTLGTAVEPTAQPNGAGLAGEVANSGLADSYTFDAEVDDVVSIWVDVPTGSTMRPNVVVVEPGGCAPSLEGGFLCTAGGTCPGLTLTVGEAGVHTVLVYPSMPMSFQEVGTETYELTVEGATATQLGDDVPRLDQYTERTGLLTAMGTTSAALPAE